MIQIQLLFLLITLNLTPVLVPHVYSNTTIVSINQYSITNNTNKNKIQIQLLFLLIPKTIKI